MRSRVKAGDEMLTLTLTPTLTPTLTLTLTPTNPNPNPNPYPNPNPNPKLQAMWKRLDEDESGFITAGELLR